MEVFYHESPFPHVTISDYYGEEELKLVWKELEFLTNPIILKSPEFTGTAKDNQGKILKQNHGVFLDLIYKDRKISNILNFSRKHFHPDIVEPLCTHNYFFRYLQKSAFDATLLSYYQDSDRYQSHTDSSTITAITWLFKEPKHFDGGDLSFTEFNYNIPIKNNFMIIFPSILYHSVSPIIMKENKEPFSGYGRYALSNFIQMR